MTNETPYESGFKLGFRDGLEGMKVDRGAPYNKENHPKLINYWKQGYKEGFKKGFAQHYPDKE